jgi:hypothetical protein
VDNLIYALKRLDSATVVLIYAIQLRLIKKFEFFEPRRLLICICLVWVEILGPRCLGGEKVLLVPHLSNWEITAGSHVGCNSAES